MGKNNFYAKILKRLFTFAKICAILSLRKTKGEKNMADLDFVLRLSMKYTPNAISSYKNSISLLAKHVNPGQGNNEFVKRFEKLERLYEACRPESYRQFKASMREFCKNCRGDMLTKLFNESENSEIIPEVLIPDMEYIDEKLDEINLLVPNEKNIEFVDAVYNSFKACNEANKKNALKINLPYYVEGKDGWYEWDNGWKPLSNSMEK